MTLRMPGAPCALALALPALAAAKPPDLPENPTITVAQSETWDGSCVRFQFGEPPVPAMSPAEMSGHPLLTLKPKKGTVDGTDPAFSPRSPIWAAVIQPYECGTFFLPRMECAPAEAERLQELISQAASEDKVENNGVPMALPTAGLDLPPAPPSLRSARVPVPASIASVSPHGRT